MHGGEGSFKPYLSPYGAWALSFGATIGWGAFLVPDTFLPQSGVMGSILGIVLGAAAMLAIAWNYHTMIQHAPDAGGAFSFTSRFLGYDHGFLCAWFLCLMYLGLIWANVSAFALFARYTLGGAFQAHFLYRIAGFNIYLEEMALCVGALVLAGIVCLWSNTLAKGVQVLCATVLAIGIVVLFVLVRGASHQSLADIQPFVPGTHPLLQTLRTITVVPWAFVGFESISHSAAEFTFPLRKVFRIMACAIGVALFCYVFMLLIAVSAIPARFESWVPYVLSLENLHGIEAVPVVSAIMLTLGSRGMALLRIALLGALFSSLVANLICLSRLFCSMAESDILPKRLARVSADGIPRNAILVILVASLPISFLGRTAIGWNVDISNVGAIIAYGYTSTVAYRVAKQASDQRSCRLGLAGMIVVGVFLILTVLPSSALAKESYLIFAGWIVLGFALNHHVFGRDRTHRFGRSPIVWVALLALMVYTAVYFVWQSSVREAAMATEAIEVFAARTASDGSLSGPDGVAATAIRGYRNAHMRDFVIVLLMILYSFYMLLKNYEIMNRREMEGERELGETKEKAYRDKLTGVKSVHAYRDRERAINKHIKTGRQDEFAVVVCDVNDLKHVNDTMGHQAGDDYLREGCRCICEAFNHSPVFRIGGDEFVVLLEGGDYQQRETIIAEFERKNLERKSQGEVVVALGMSEWDRSKDPKLADVFARADEAMYERKRSLKAG